MTTNREHWKRGEGQRDPRYTHDGLARRRAEMHAAEGHAGSIPRGNQQQEREVVGSHRIAWDRVLGH